MHHRADQAADRFVVQPIGRDARVFRFGFRDRRADQRQRAQLIEREQPRAQPVIEIVVGVGDVIGEGRHLRLRRGPRAEIEIEHRAEPGEVPVRRGDGAVVLRQPLQRLPGQVQPVEGGVAPLQRRHHAHRLGIVVEAALARHGLVQRLLAGMAEGRMAEIVGEGQRLGEILVQREPPRDRTRDLRHLQRVRQAGAVVVALMRDEDLRLVLEPAEGR
jgi:hypothetical protein